MKTRTIIGQEEETEDIVIREYKGGTTVIETGDSCSQTFVKNKKLIKETKMKATKEQVKKLIYKHGAINK